MPPNSEEPAIIYCDGACSDNQSRKNAGGWGVVVKTGGRVVTAFGGERNTTNQRMELTSCIKGLEMVGSTLPARIFSDSAYLVNCFRDQWYVRWQKNGWKNAKGQPVENRDLWERLLALSSQHAAVFNKVAGHSGDTLNSLADELARKGARSV